MKNLLQEIANTLSITAQRVTSPGLLNGTMGIILFFYEYARFAKDSYYETFADHLLDSVLNSKDKRVVDFNDGIAGIGWGVQYLLMNGFIEGEPDEALSEYDNIIFQYLPRPGFYLSKNSDPVFSPGLYFLARFRNNDDDRDRRVIVELANSCEKALSWKYTAHLGLFNSILYFLNNISDRLDDLSFLQQLYKKTLEGAKLSLSNNFCDKKDLQLLEKLLSQSGIVDNELFQKLEQAHRKTSQQQINPIDLFVKSSWLQLIYGEVITPEKMKHIDVEIYLQDILFNYDPSDLTLSMGLTGLGFGILKNQQMTE